MPHLSGDALLVESHCLQSPPKSALVPQSCYFPTLASINASHSAKGKKGKQPFTPENKDSGATLPVYLLGALVPVSAPRNWFQLFQTQCRIRTSFLSSSGGDTLGMVS